MRVAYTFPNGFAKQAEHMHGWLRHYNLQPKIRIKNGETLILLPENQIDCLRLMQQHEPARFGRSLQ